MARGTVGTVWPEHCTGQRLAVWKPGLSPIKMGGLLLAML